MIQIVIFSYNRAMQLDALLSSIKEHWTLSEVKVSILYNTSSEKYQKGYDLLKTIYPFFYFWKESKSKPFYKLSDYFSIYNMFKIIKYKHCRKIKTNFRELLNYILDDKCNYIMFLTDDSVFIKDVQYTKLHLDYIDKNLNQNSISLRMGLKMNDMPEMLKLRYDIIKWNYSDYKNKNNWSYRFSVDGHIYSMKKIKHLVKKIIFNNPTTLESHILDYSNKFRILKSGITFKEPYLLSFPINIVQSIADNESQNLSVSLLNDYFLNGYKIQYDIPQYILKYQQYPNVVRLYSKIDSIELHLNIPTCS